MTNQIALSQTSTSSTSLPADATPQEIARDMLAENNRLFRGYDFPALRQSVDALAQVDPQLAQEVETAIIAQLGPREQTQFANATYAVDAGEGGSITIAQDAPSIQSYFDGTASGDPAANREFYARLDRAFGDGDPTTNDTAAIEAGIGLLIRGDISLEQYETLRAAGLEDSANVNEVVLDLTQMTLDIVGIFDQSGVSDGANALISAGRGDWVGAGLSALAIVPVVGALAAAGKLGRWAETVANAIDLAASNPAARRALEPMLQRLNDAIGGIPDGVMRNLPDEMRTTLEGLKTRLDDFFGVAARRFDFVDRGSGTHLRRTVDVDGQTIQINSGHAYNRAHSGGDVRASGLSMDQIDNAIANDIVARIDVDTIPGVPQSTSRTIDIDGYSLTYDVTRLPNGNISVSTYYPGP